MAEPRKLLVATGNLGKLAEFEQVLAPLGYALLSKKDVPFPEVIESGHDFVTNARLKAWACAALTGYLTLADDSGLEVDALGGAPGVRSARFAGEDASDADNRELLLNRLFGVPRRTARFRCALVLVDPVSGIERVAGGSCEGEITNAERGEGGFGYDSLFQPRGEERTMAELSASEKHAISHRGQAVATLRDVLARSRVE